MWEYVIALGFFVVFNAVGILSVWFSHKKRWTIDLTDYRHYTTLIFNICGIIYALFLGFIIWDVWERFYDLKQTVQSESHFMVDLYRTATVFPEEGEESIQGALKAYTQFVVDVEWGKMGNKQTYLESNHLLDNIWQAYYRFTPSNERETIWFSESLTKLTSFTNSRMNRMFNIQASVGGMRWTLLLLGGLILVTIPCFFKVDLFAFKLILTLFLANIIAFMLMITYSLDHPFKGYQKVDSFPFEYALKIIQPW